MEEVDRTPQPGKEVPGAEIPQPEAPAAAPGENPAGAFPPAAPETPDCWADLAPGALSQDPQALLAAWMAGRALPRRLLMRRIFGVVALAALLGCVYWAFAAVSSSNEVAWWQLFVPFVPFFLFMLALKDLPLRFFLRRALRRMEDATLYPDRLHLVTPAGEKDLPLCDLTLVQRFRGWTVLAWRDGLRPCILPLSDDAYYGEGTSLYARLQDTVPGARFLCSPKPPCRKRHLPASLAAALLLFIAFLLLANRWSGEQILSSPSPGQGSIAVGYRAGEHQLSNFRTGIFPYPAAGAPVFHWQGRDVCAVTYPSTDGSVRVQLLEPYPGKADRLDPDPPTGLWREFALTDVPATLRWDEENQCYHLNTAEGETVYHQWEDFDGLGLALCDDRSVPEWTLVPSVMPWFNDEGSVTDFPVLLLCAVSMEDVEPLVLFRADETADGTASAESAAPQTAALQFDDTIDVCVNENGVFFTWDGATASQALTADDCARAGITSEADLDPLVLRWDVASFLTVEGGRVYSYTSTDQGGTWQRAQLVTLASDTLTDRCYGFAGTGQGYAALSGTDANGALWVNIYQTLDHGASWDHFPTPKAADGVLRPLNGLCFYDAGTAVATAPGDDGSPWPYVFATADDGYSWVEPEIPFADSGQTGAVRLTDLYFSDTGDWLVTFTQAPEGTREIVFETPDLANAPWAFSSVHDVS